MRSHSRDLHLPCTYHTLLEVPNTSFSTSTNFDRTVLSDDPVPISEPRQSMIAPCLGKGAHEAIAGYTEFSLQRCQ